MTRRSSNGSKSRNCPPRSAVYGRRGRSIESICAWATCISVSQSARSAASSPCGPVVPPPGDLSASSYSNDPSRTRETIGGVSETLMMTESSVKTVNGGWFGYLVADEHGTPRADGERAPDGRPAGRPGAVGQGDGREARAAPGDGAGERLREWRGGAERPVPEGKRPQHEGPRKRSTKWSGRPPRRC